MPAAVVSFIGSNLVSLGSVLGAGSAGALTAMAVGAAAVVAGAVAAQKLISELYSVPNLDSDRSRQATVRGTVEPQKLIYGEALVSGPISFVGVAGTDNRDLYHAIVLAGHPSDSISDIYFDDERIQSAHINASGNVTTGTFGPKDGTTICVIRKLTGSQTTADSVLDGAFSTINSSEHIGTNLTYIVTKFTLTDKSQETWDKFMPNDIKALVKGKKVYDPRQDSTSTYYDANVGVGTQRSNDSTTWEWSENPVWCLVDYLTDDRFGMDIDLDRIDLSKAVDAADICDATVSVPGGSEKRYTCNGVVFGTSTHKANINKLLSAMNGMLTYTNGKYVIRAGAFEAVGTGMTLTEDHMTGPVRLKTSFERNERFNTITGTFIDPSKNYKEIEFPKVQITSALTRDNNEELTRELKLSMTNSRYMAQRIAHKLIQLSDLQKVLTFPTNLAGVNISVGDRVSVTLSEFGYTNKTFVCLGWTLSESGSGGVNLTLREDDSSSYADLAQSGYSTVTPAGGIQQGFFGVPDPSGLSATAHVESIELDWTNPANMTGIIAIEVFASPNSSWSSAVKIGETLGTQFIHDESNGVDSIVEGDQRYYWVRARRFPSGEGSDAVSDRNPDSDTSTVQATKGALGNLADLDTVGEAQIDDNAVGNDQIADDAVDTDQIADDAVTVDKIANTLESTNYVANTSGWRLTTAGDFEAGDGTFRGAVTATSGSFGGTTIASNKIYQGTGTWANSNTGFYLDNTGQFSLKDSLFFNPTNSRLTVSGNITADTITVEDTLEVFGPLKAKSLAAGSITREMLSQDVLDEIFGALATSVGGSNGDYKEGTGNFTTSGGTVTLGTSSDKFDHGTADVDVEFIIDHFFYATTNYTTAQAQATLNFEVSADGTFTDLTSATKTHTLQFLEYDLSSYYGYTYLVYYLTGDVTKTFTSGSGNDIPDDTDLQFRVRVTGVGTAFTNQTVPFTLEANEGVTGVVSTGGNADTLDNLDSTAFLRSNTNDTFDGDLTITGQLILQGSIDQYNVTDLDVTDKTITVNSGNTQSLSDGAGLIVDRGTASDASILWDETNDEFDFSHPIKVAGSVGVTNIVTNKVVKFNGTIFDDSNITDTGSAITLGSNTTVSGTLSSGAITTSGNIQQNYGYELRGKDSGGTVRTLLRTNSNKLQIGWSYAGDVEFMGGGSYTKRMAISGSTGDVSIVNDLSVSGNISGVSGHVSGKFAVKSTGVHPSYDLYNNGTTYLNGSTIIDDSLDLTGGNAALKVAGTTVISSTRRLTPTGIQMSPDTGLYATDATLSYYSSSNAVYLNGAGANGWLRLNASGNANDRTAINLFGQNVGDNITFKTASSERMRISSGGNVGINATSPAATLHTVANSGTTALLTVGAASNNIASFYTSGSSQVMTLDASGNLLVGTTDKDTQNNNAGSTADNGFVYNIGSGGYLNVARYGGTVAYFNRTSTDGTIADFRKDGTTVGSIGTFSTDLYIGTNDTGLRFEYAGINTIIPFDVNSLGISDGATDLGHANARFKDLYLSGDINLGGANEQVSSVYRADVTGVNSSSYVTAFTVTGSELGSSIRATFVGYSTNVVVNCVADILVNHSQDILIQTLSGFYATLSIKVTSDNNEDFAVEIKHSGSTSTTIKCEVVPLNNESVTFTSSHSFTGNSHEHSANHGFDISGSGGNTGTLRTAGDLIASNAYVENTLYHQGDTNTYLKFDTDRIRLYAGGNLRFDSNNIYLTSGSVVDLSSTQTISGTKIFNADIIMGTSSTFRRSNHHMGHMEGSYNDVGNNASKSNPIYTIGSNYNPTDAALSNMYGIGFSRRDQATFLSAFRGSGWGLYVAADGDARIFLNATDGLVASTGGYDVGNVNVIDSSRNLTNIGNTSGTGSYTTEGSHSSYGTIRIAHPKGADVYSRVGSQSGAIKITLPQSWTNTMMWFTIEVYEYSSEESFTVKVGGYNYSGNTTWINRTATIISNGNKDRNFTVRFAHDGTKCCIFIGDLTSTWSYPQVAVTDFIAGFSNATIGNWDDGWDASFETSSYGTVSGTHTQTDNNIHHTNIKIGGTEVIDTARNLTNILGLYGNGGTLNHYNTNHVFKSTTSNLQAQITDTGIGVGVSPQAVGAGNTTAGLSLYSDGRIFASKSGNTVMSLNRNTSNGVIAEFRYAGNTIGNLGVEGGDSLYIQSDGSTGGGLRFHQNGVISPVRNGAVVNNTIDLGTSTQQFRELYLGSGLFMSGTQVIDSSRNIKNAPTVLVNTGSNDTSSSMAGQTPKLYVNGYTSLGGLRINGADTGNTIYKSGGDLSIIVGSSNFIKLGTGGGERLRIDTSGYLRLGGSATNATQILSSVTSTSSSGGAGTGNKLRLEFMEPSYPNYGARHIDFGVRGGGYVEMRPSGGGLYMYSPYNDNDQIHLGYGGIQLFHSHGGYTQTNDLIMRSVNGFAFQQNNGNNWFRISPSGTLEIGSSNTAILTQSRNLQNIASISSGTVTITRGVGDQQSNADSGTVPTTSSNPVMVINGNFTDGRYQSRFIKVDRIGNLPLYYQESAGTANSYTNILRFGSHGNTADAYRTYKFFVFGDFGGSGNLTAQRVKINNTTVIDSGRNLNNVSAINASGEFKSTSQSSNAVKTRFISGAAGGSTSNGPLYINYGKTDGVNVFQATSGNPNLLIYGNDNGTQRYGSLSVGTDGSFNVSASDTYLILSAASYIQSNKHHNFLSNISIAGTTVIDSNRQFLVNSHIYFGGATNQSFIRQQNTNLEFFGDGNLSFRTYNGGWYERLNVDDGGINVTGTVEIGGTTVIDSSRNITSRSIFAQGNGTTSSTSAITAQNSSGTTIFRARDDGRVLIPSGYLYAQHAEGIYSTGSIKARGGITNDGGNALSISSGAAHIAFNSKNFASVGTISSGQITSSGSVTAGSASSALGFYVGTTQVITGTRNLVNIGSINCSSLSTSDGGSVKLWTSSATSAGQLHVPRAGHISFYGDTSNHHAIMSRNNVGGEADDIRINSYADVWINLDSNNNNDANANFYIGRHGGGYGTIDLLLSVDGEDGDLITEGNVTAYGSPSDIRLKENVERIADPINRVKQLDGITFDYKKDGSRSTGLIAQQLLEVLPEVVYETQDLNTGEEHYAVRYGNVVGLLVEAIKAQQETIESLTKRIEELENGDN